MNNRVSFWPRGKVLGGSSSINYMNYVRGHPEDYDSWGVPGWGYSDVLPFFKKSEDVKIPELAGSELHGTGGPLQVTQVDPHPLSTAYLNAASQAGIAISKDYNDPEQMVGHMGYSQVTIGANGKRCSTADFVNQVAWRSNLHVRTYCQATKVLFEAAKVGPKAVGMQYVRTGGQLKGNERRVVRARKEVILSGGAIGSPHLLMLSGVGDRKQLEEQGIECVLDQPHVGKNLMDHLMVGIEYESLIPSITKGEILRPSTLAKYALFGTGRLASPGLELCGFVRTGVRPDLQAPDAQIHFFATGGVNEDVAKQTQAGLPHNLNVRPEIVLSAVDPRTPNPYRMIALSVLLHPKSRGHVSLRSPDPFDRPLIEPNYLSHPDDVATLVAAGKLSDQIFQQKAFDGIRGPVVTSKFIPSELKEAEPDAYWKFKVKSGAVTVYHPVGTCKIGTASDPGRVVDERLRVVGVSGLRVCDASIIPSSPSGNTNAPSIMVGERGADLILHDHSLKSKL
jgi:choline dehydrogenase-like flavoprotein